MSSILTLSIDFTAVIDGKRYHKQDLIKRTDPATRPAFNHTTHLALYSASPQLFPLTLDYASSGYMMVRNLDELNSIHIGGYITGEQTVKLCPKECAIYKPYSNTYAIVTQVVDKIRIEFITFDVAV